MYQSIHACQHGYLSRLSCVSQLVEVLATIGLHLDRGRQIDTIFLDMSKAFDKVSHRKLIAKLTHYGFGGNILRWFTFCLSNRKRRVTIPGGPPGSHFRSHVLAVCKWFSRGCQIQSCGCICRCHKHFQSHQVAKQRYGAPIRLGQYISNWADTTNMVFNSTKSKAMRITRMRNPTESTYMLCGSTLERTNCEKDLGVWISDNLTWSMNF